MMLIFKYKNKRNNQKHILKIKKNDQLETGDSRDQPTVENQELRTILKH